MSLTTEFKINNPKPKAIQLTTEFNLKAHEALRGYRRPSHGIFRFIPASWIPYAELMRLDRQAGFWAFYWHYLIGLGFAINIRAVILDASVVSILKLALHLAAWTTVFRGILCTWNDNLDQDLDRQVARSRVRLIARGAVSIAQAHIFMLAQIVVGAAILYPLTTSGGGPWNPTLGFHALVDAVLGFIDPLLKRYTHFPQVELGMALSYAIFLALAATGEDPLAPLFKAGPGGLSLSDSVAGVVASPIAQSALYLYLAGVIWTVIFDTIYAHQDHVDDLKAWVMGVAVLLGREGTKPACYIAIAVQIYLLVLAGQLAEFGIWYFLMSCGVTGLVLTWMVSVTSLEDGKSCAWALGKGSGWLCG
ncbi:putative 4-hydroxybenzoate polyprenyl protein [Rhypophila decipiens]